MRARVRSAKACAAAATAWASGAGAGSPAGRPRLTMRVSRASSSSPAVSWRSISADSCPLRSSRALKTCSPSRMVAFSPAMARSAISVAVTSSEMVARSDCSSALSRRSCRLSRTQYRMVSSSRIETMLSIRNPKWVLTAPPCDLSAHPPFRTWRTWSAVCATPWRRARRRGRRPCPCGLRSA